MTENKYIFRACGFAFFMNLALFLVKLYIGLRSNSISIFSDAVNNLFDSLSGLVSLLGIFVLTKKSVTSSDNSVRKGEQLFSFLIAVTVAFAGLYFAYSSIERFMYPTPVWFMVAYAWTLGMTVAAKIFMYFVYRYLYKKSASPVISVMKVDCILDMCITAITIVTLIVSHYGTYSVDAVFGLIISIIIVVSAVKMIISCGRILLDYVPVEIKEQVFEILDTSEYATDKSLIGWINDGEKFTALIPDNGSGEEKREILSDECLREAGVTLKFIR